MFTYIIEHKYCKMQKAIKGETLANAFQINKLDYAIWKVIDIRKEG